MTPVFPPAILDERRTRVARELGLQDELLVVGAGTPVPLPEISDQTYPFRAHAEYFYLSGLECPHAVMAFDPADGLKAGWRSFVPEVTEDERVWEGRRAAPGEPLAALEQWLHARVGRPIANLGAPVASIVQEPALTTAVRERFQHARRPKDSAECTLLRDAAAATAAGYAALASLIRPGVTERRLQIELEAAFFRAGASTTGYGTIVGSGPNSAILHVAPSDRVVREGEFVLIDAGAEINRYVCDVTRTYVAGRPLPEQRDMYQLVHDVQVRAVAACRPGVEWRDLHLRVARELTEGLVNMGLLRGEPDDLVERGVHTLFFPHGLGHLVGLGVRDASGTIPGRTKDQRPILATLRADLPLKPGYVVTVEPGLYFIPALLQDSTRRARHRNDVNWEFTDRLLHLGGVRVEDNVLVTEGDPEVLTASIPKALN